MARDAEGAERVSFSPILFGLGIHYDHIDPILGREGPLPSWAEDLLAHAAIPAWDRWRALLFNPRPNCEVCVHGPTWGGRCAAQCRAVAWQIPDEIGKHPRDVRARGGAKGGDRHITFHPESKLEAIREGDGRRGKAPIIRFEEPDETAGESWPALRDSAWLAAYQSVGVGIFGGVRPIPLSEFSGTAIRRRPYRAPSWKTVRDNLGIGVSRIRRAGLDSVPHGFRDVPAWHFEDTQLWVRQLERVGHIIIPEDARARRWSAKLRYSRTKKGARQERAAVCLLIEGESEAKIRERLGLSEGALRKLLRRLQVRSAREQSGPTPDSGERTLAPLDYPGPARILPQKGPGVP